MVSKVIKPKGKQQLSVQFPKQSLPRTFCISVLNDYVRTALSQANDQTLVEFGRPSLMFVFFLDFHTFGGKPLNKQNNIYLIKLKHNKTTEYFFGPSTAPILRLLDILWLTLVSATSSTFRRAPLASRSGQAQFMQGKGRGRGQAPTPHERNLEVTSPQPQEVQRTRRFVFLVRKNGRSKAVGGFGKLTKRDLVPEAQTRVLGICFFCFLINRSHLNGGHESHHVGPGFDPDPRSCDQFV